MASAKKTARRVTFGGMNTIHEIINRENFTREEMDAAFYSRKETHRMFIECVFAPIPEKNPRRVTFGDMDTVHEIINRENFTREEMEAAFYSREETHRMREAAENDEDVVPPVLSTSRTPVCPRAPKKARRYPLVGFLAKPTVARIRALFQRLHILEENSAFDSQIFINDSNRFVMFALAFDEIQKIQCELENYYSDDVEQIGRERWKSYTFLT